MFKEGFYEVFCNVTYRSCVACIQVTEDMHGEAVTNVQTTGGVGGKFSNTSRFA